MTRSWHRWMVLLRSSSSWTSRLWWSSCSNVYTASSIFYRDKHRDTCVRYLESIFKTSKLDSSGFLCKHFIYPTGGALTLRLQLLAFLWETCDPDKNTLCMFSLVSPIPCSYFMTLLVPVPDVAHSHAMEEDDDYETKSNQTHDWLIFNVELWGTSRNQVTSCCNFTLSVIFLVLGLFEDYMTKEKNIPPLWNPSHRDKALKLETPYRSVAKRRKRQHI